MENFSGYFFEQWINKLPYLYENITNILKKENMLKDWSAGSIATPFTNISTITSDLELKAYQWTIKIDCNMIMHRFHTFYVVPSSTPIITPSQWLFYSI